MKIGLDGRFLEGNATGLGKYTKNLITGLTKRDIDCVVFYSKEQEKRLMLKNVKSVILESSYKYVFEQFLLPIALKSEKIDIYHATGNMGVPIFNTIPSVLTVHDVIPLQTENYFSSSKYPLLSKLSYLLRLKSSLLAVDRIVSVSNYTKKQLISVLHIPPSKICVIKYGISKVNFTKSSKYKFGKNSYILNHGGIDSRKNLDGLILAFKVVHKQFPKLKLVITGDNPEMLYKLKKLVSSLRLTDAIYFTGYVEERTLWTLLKGSLCVCYPSMVEGYGLPILEAYLAGIPVVTSNTTSIPEIAENAALLVNPNSIEQISSSVIKLVTNKKLVNKMIKRGYEISKKYSLERTIDRIIVTYEQLL